jgi:hypothetical protein
MYIIDVREFLSGKWAHTTARASPSHSCVDLEHKRGVFTTRHTGPLDTALVLLFMTSVG